MNLDIIFTWAAQVDFQRAFSVMEDASEGAGVRLSETTGELLELTAQHPFIARVWHSPVRRHVLERTHYGLFYVVEPRRLVVIAFRDLREDPNRLMQEVMGRLPQ